MRKLLPELSAPGRTFLSVAVMVLLVILGGLNMAVIGDLQARDKAREESSRNQRILLDNMACSLDVSTESAIGIAEFLDGQLKNARPGQPIPPEVTAAIERLKRNAERAGARQSSCPYPAGSGAPVIPPATSPDH